MSAKRPVKRRNLARKSLMFETLELRSLLSISTPSLPTQASNDATVSKTAHIASDDVRIARTNVSPLANADSPNGPFAPADIRHAYGFDSILLGGSVVGDGTGQTIAVIDPYNDPNIASDLDAFDNSFSINGGSQKIYQQYGPASTFFTVLQLQGTPPNAPLDGWAEEMSLDVEWLHALAPKAHIDLFEALSPNVVNADGSEGDMLKAVDSARATTGVSVVSMSWGVPEFANESNYDSHFTSLTGPGDPFVTFLAATGDTGSPGAYPAYSPNVVAVGGTLLNIESFAGNYLGETAWSGSGGGTSQFESEPSFQSSLQSTTKRTIPDVSANSGSRTDGSDVSIYDSYDIGGNHWGAAYGTSFSVLVWGATVAIADQGRANIGLPSLDGPSQTLPEIYKLPSSHIWDITSGSNGGFQAGPGYDEVTGRGTPMANMAAPNLVPGVISPSSLQSSIVSSQVAQVGNLNEQDVFVVGSDGLVREDRFFYGTGQSTGQAIIDPTTTFNAGTKLSVYSDGSSTNVFAVGQDGKLKWAQYTKTGGWTAFVTVDSLISGSDITFPAGAPLAGYASSGNFDLFAVANDGYVRQYAYYTSSHSWQSYSFGNAYSFGAGAPLAVWDSGSHVDIFGIYPDGTLERLRYVSGWVPSNYGADGQAPPRGSLAIWESGSFTDLYAVTASGDVDEIYSNDGTTWHGGNVVSVGSNKLTTGQQLAIAELSDGGVELFGMGASGNIVQVQKSSGSWGVYENYGGFVPSSSVSEYVSTSPFVMQVFALGTDGQLYLAQYAGGWNEYELNPAINPTSLQSSLVSSQVNQSGGLYGQFVFVVGNDGLVREASYSYYGPAQTFGQTVIDSSTRFAFGAKLTLYSDGSDLNVFGVGLDGKLKFDQYTQAGGWTGFVNVDSLIPGSNITFPAGASLAGYASSGNFDLFAVANDGYVRQYAYYTSSHSWHSYSFGNAYNFGGGAPLAVWDSGSHVDIFGIYPDGTLEQLRYVSGWVPSNHGGDGQTPPQAPLAIWESGSFTDLYAVTASGDVDEIYSNDGTTWHGGNVVSVGSNKLTTGQQLAIAELSDGGVELFGMGVSGYIIQVQKSGGSWGPYETYGGFVPSSSVSEYVSTSPFVMQVVGLGTDGNLYVAEYDGSWNEYNIG